METILEEIRQALKARLWYAAIALALTLPDICATLEAPANARKDGQKARYKNWCRKYLDNRFGLDDDLCWELRSGVVHEGRYKHKGFDRVVFTTPNGGTVHNAVLEHLGVRVLTLEVSFFCDQMTRAVRTWHGLKRSDQAVRENIERLVRPRPDGLMPWFKGAVVIG